LGWILGANSSPWSKFHSNSKFQEEVILNSRPREFPEFSFQIPSESEEVSKEKVVYPFEMFKTIFYFNFLELDKVPFGSVKILKSLTIFEPFKFENVLNCLTPCCLGL
jgi:hypothetical protein